MCVSLSLSPAGRASHIPMPVNNNAVVLSVLAMFLPLPHGFVSGMCEAERKEYETWVFEWVYVYVCVCVCVCQAYYILVFSTKLCFSTFFLCIFFADTHSTSLVMHSSDQCFALFRVLYCCKFLPPLLLSCYFLQAGFPCWYKPSVSILSFV